MAVPMNLSDWRKAEGVSQKQMASRLSARLGRTVHPPSICQWESGIMPGADAAEAIRLETGGKVTGDTFVRRPKNPEPGDATA